MGTQLAGIIGTIGRFYALLLIIYVLLSWFQNVSAVEEVRRVLGTIVEPYLSIFRRFIPPIGAIDISPIVAYFALIFGIVPLLQYLVSFLGRV